MSFPQQQDLSLLGVLGFSVIEEFVLEFRRFGQKTSAAVVSVPSDFKSKQDFQSQTGFCSSRTDR